MSETSESRSNSKHQLLRHILATLAYRGAKAIANAPEGFATFRVNGTSRTPAEILAHLGDLLDWALCVAKGEYLYSESKSLAWEEGATRFFSSLKRFDDYLASEAPLGYSVEKIFQGPIADALTHVGQIGMLRRMAGAPVRGESYFKADIVAGRVGAEQSTVRAEFD